MCFVSYSIEAVSRGHSLCLPLYLCIRERKQSRLYSLLPLLSLLIPLRINHARERILPPPRDTIRRRNNARQEQSRRLSIPQRSGQKAQRAAMIHGRLADVERERRYRRVHQDAEVVAKICACDAERPHGGQDESVAGEEEGNRGIFDEGVEESGVGWLGGKGFVVTDL
jgi:hypothetical protein